VPRNNFWARIPRAGFDSPKGLPWVESIVCSSAVLLGTPVSVALQLAFLRHTNGLSVALLRDKPSILRSILRSTVKQAFRSPCVAEENHHTRALGVVVTVIITLPCILH
jgi:hypothetical protein